MVGKTYLRYVVGPQGGAVVSKAALTIDSVAAPETYNNNTIASNSNGENNNLSNYHQYSQQQWQSNVARAHRLSAHKRHTPVQVIPAVLFVPALEAVHIYAVRTGKRLHTLIPAALTMPVEVTSLRVYSQMEEKMAASAVVVTSRAHVSPRDIVTSTPTTTRTNKNSSVNAENNKNKAQGTGKGKNAQIEKRHDNTLMYYDNNVIESSSRSIAHQGWMCLVGYSNGYVSLFTCGPHNNYGNPVCVFYALGHKIDTNVLSLCCDSQRLYGCSAGQDTDLTVWDLTALEPTFRLRGHRGAIVGMEFVNSHISLATANDIVNNNNNNVNNNSSNSNSRSNVQCVISASADGLLKVWDILLRQCIQSILVADTPLTAMVMDYSGRRVYCGMRESFIKVYRTDKLIYNSPQNEQQHAQESATMSGMTPSFESQQEEFDILFDHGAISRKYHKPITSFHFSQDQRLLLACTGKTIEIYKQLSSSEVRRKVQRKRQRQRHTKKDRANHSKSETQEKYSHHHEHLDHNSKEVEEKEESEEEEEEEEEPLESEELWEEEHEQQQQQQNKDLLRSEMATNENSKKTNNVLANATAAEEIVLLRTFFMSDKVRSACFVPPDEMNNTNNNSNNNNNNSNNNNSNNNNNYSSSRRGGGAGENELIHIAVTFANNSIITYVTEHTSRNTDGAAVATLTDLKVKFTFTERAHHNDIKQLCFVNNDSALLSMSSERVLLWNLVVEDDLLDVDHLDRSDFYDAQEANIKRTTFKGSLNCVGSVSVHEATSMTAISSALCCVGQDNGTVLLLDVNSSEVLCEETTVHIGGVKDIITRSDHSGFLSVGTDRRLIVWTIGLLENESEDNATHTSNNINNNNNNNNNNNKKNENNNNNKSNEDNVVGKSRVCHAQAALLQTQEIELAEAPLFAQFSAEDKFLAVGLQNNTIQLFFADSFKPYLALFGHKLPPTAVAFTSDNTLVASTGMDKSLRFWGTDFGDCHKAIHAHDDYVTAVVFQPQTHYAFTVSLDGSMKMWDGDNWTMIQLFRQHQRGLWSVSVTYNGTCVATAGVDRSIRCFLRTQDIVFPEEEEEKMAQEAMDEENASRLAQQRLESNTVEQEVGIVGHPTASTAEAAERLMEALDLVSVEQQRKHNPEDKAKHPLLTNCTEWEYLWSIIESIRPSELRHALSVLTSVHVDALFSYLHTMLTERAVHNYEIASKIILALLLPAPGQPATMTSLRTIATEGESTHNVKNINNNSNDINTTTTNNNNDKDNNGVSSDVVSGARRLMELRKAISKGLDESVEVLDYNIAALQMVRSYLEENAKVKFYDLSAIQGFKKQYHNKVIHASNK